MEQPLDPGSRLPSDCIRTGRGLVRVMLSARRSAEYNKRALTPEQIAEFRGLLAEHISSRRK
jgi:hypothetical protein